MSAPRRHLLVVGAQRCGTTYVHSLLDAHPDIAVARPARPEPKVFLSDALAARGIEWYHATYFAHATSESLLAEKSTSYLEYAETADRAAAVLGQAEILVVLRDPVDRAVSNWQFSTHHGMEERSLARALTENLLGSRAWDPTVTSVSPYAYLERGRYADHLRPWFSRFPESMHVHFFEDLVARPGAVAELYAGLGVDPGVRPAGLGQRVNASEQQAPELDPELTARLRAYFRDSDDALRALLGYDLPWADVRSATTGVR